MLGYAAQKGLLPVTLASLEQAIRLNGTFIDGNLRTLALGRLAAHDPEALARELAPKTQGVAPLVTVDDRSEEHTSELQSLMRISYSFFCLKKKKNQL